MRQQSLEDAARATKIRANQLADLEADDYTNFANLAYARSYLANYAKYMKVDARPYMDAFSDASTFGVDDYQYLSDKPVGQYRIPYRRPGRARRPARKQLVGAALGLAAMGIGIFGWILAVNIQRLGPRDTLAQRLEAAREQTAQLNAAPAKVDATATVSTSSAPGAVVAPAASPAQGIFNPTEHLMGEGPAGMVIPVSVPFQPPTASTPAPSVAPAPVNVPASVSIPALAVTTTPSTVGPVLPLSGDGRAVIRELFTTAHDAQLQTQKVSNDHPRGQ